MRCCLWAETLMLLVRLTLGAASVAPIIVLEPYPYIPVAGNGESIIATCKAKNGIPRALVKWESEFKFSYTQSVTRPTINGSVTSSSELRINPTREMNGQYVYCVVEHPALKPPERLAYKLNIHYLTSVTITTVKTGKENLQMKCIADSNPKPTNYTWTRGNHSLPKSIIVQEGGILSLPKITPDLAGLYMCEAFNKAGSAKGFLYLDTVKCEESYHVMVYIIIVLLVIVIAVLSFFLHKKKSPTRNDTPSQQAEPLQQCENRSKDQV